MEDEAKKILVLIDSNAIIHRAYHALPKNMSTSKGELTNAVYGYATTLIKVLEDLHPTHIAASFDIGKATFRLAEFADYKATRVAADQELYDQIPKVKELLEAFDIPIYTSEGHEADDCIGTIVQKIQDTRYKVQESNNRAIEQCNSFKIYIVTGDKDTFQLLNGDVFIYWLKKGLSESAIVDSKKVKEQFDLDPEDFIDLKALAGDPSDNIPGVPGIGPKTATTLLQTFDTLKGLYVKLKEASDELGLISKSKFQIPNQIPNSNEPIDKLKIEKLIGNWKLEIDNLTEEGIKNLAKKLDIKPRIAKLLLEYKDQAFLSQKLATICRDVPIEINLEDMKWGDYDKQKVRDFFKRMQFHSLLRRFGVESAEEPKTKEAKEQKEKDEQLKLL